MRSKAIWAFLLAVLGVTVYAANVLATPATGFTGTTIAKATYGEIYSHVHTVPAYWSEKIQTKGDSDLYVQQNVVEPGGSSGWHTHPGPSFIIVTEGSITAYEGDDHGCTARVYTAGTANNAFVDPGDGHVHILRNETNATARTVAVQFVPAGAVRRQDEPDPGNCVF